MPYDAPAEPNYGNRLESGALPYDSIPGSNPFPPENNQEIWEPTDPNWMEGPLDTDTPESPPMFEKEGYSDPIEYHDNVDHGSGAGDVDHRVLPSLASPAVGASK